jgi:hypothetical protein
MHRPSWRNLAAVKWPELALLVDPRPCRRIDAIGGLADVSATRST